MSDLDISQIDSDLGTLAKNGVLDNASATMRVQSAIDHPLLMIEGATLTWHIAPDLLNIPTLKGAFPHLTLDHFHAIGSTNDHLMALDASAFDRVAVAECQLSGRGRRHRAWVSPYARSLSISHGHQSSRPLAELGGLSTVIGIVLCQLFRHLGVAAGLKWPNDLLVNGEKLCGILVELNNTEEGVAVVVGVGVNVDLTAREIAEVSQPVTDLRRHGVSMPRTEIAQMVIEVIDLGCRRFQTEGFDVFVSEFDDLHIYHDQVCNILLGDSVEQGRVLGIAPDGALRLQTADGEKAYHGGEVSLRPAE